jgi:predicted AAA+ superfamily ATPase
MLFTDLLKHRGVSLIYGPRGAGKSTLIEVVVKGVKRLGGFENYAFTHFHFDEG